MGIGWRTIFPPEKKTFASLKPIRAQHRVRLPSAPREGAHNYSFGNGTFTPLEFGEKSARIPSQKLQICQKSRRRPVSLREQFQPPENVFCSPRKTRCKPITPQRENSIRSTRIDRFHQKWRRMHRFVGNRDRLVPQTCVRVFMRECQCLKHP